MKLVVVGDFDESAAAQFAAAGATDLYVLVDDLDALPSTRVFPSGAKLGLMTNPWLLPQDQVERLARRAATRWPCAICTHGSSAWRHADPFPGVADANWLQLNVWDHDDALFFDEGEFAASVSGSPRFAIFLNGDIDAPLLHLVRESDQHPEWGEFTSADVARFLDDPNVIVGANWSVSDIDWALSRPKVPYGLAFTCTAYPARKPGLRSWGKSPAETIQLLERVSATLSTRGLV